ncbi:FMN-binding domain-containing protein [Solimonas aquatica]|uniref:FMN-binding domain-containing protein n=2 Tax=Solimonas aquatica TaxID=489703 RepID=A0A1H9D3F1_9GAMM|nr:FMN-binding domain-containing protein [Solimonas aquatica]
MKEKMDTEFASSAAMPVAGRRSLLRLLASLPLLLTQARRAEAFDVYTTYQTADAFVAEAFAPGAAPAPQTLMLDAARQAQVASVFGKPFPQARLRYWRAAGRSAWIFDDVGKDGYVPTTCGFVVTAGSIEHARVLIYRESRGQQVAEPSFLKQLIGAHAAGAGLDRNVDNISGATLSVKMMQRMARTALLFDTLAS